MSENQFDARLRDVPLPSGMLARLRRIADEASAPGVLSGWLSDSAIDQRLRDVALPVGLADRLRRQRRPARRAAWRPLAVAASVVLAVGVSYLSALATLVASSFELEARVMPRLEAQDSIETRWAATEDVALWANVVVLPTATGDAVLNNSVSFPPSGPDAVGYVAIEDVEVSAPTQGIAGLDSSFPPVGPDVPLLAAGSRFPSESFRAAITGALRPGDLRRPPPRGVEPPSVAAYPLQMQLLTGIHPAVSPAADPQLQTSRVPLTSGTTSFDQARHVLEAGQLPAPAGVRIEDFLAAVDYGFVPPTGQPVALHVAAGPSPFGQAELGLLQIAVQAADLPAVARPATHLTLLVDASAGMRQGDRLAMMGRAIGDLAPRLKADDRVSLVIFRREAEVLAEYFRPDQLGVVLDKLATVEARSETDFVAGLRAAYALAEGGSLEDELDWDQRPVSIARRVVLITDGGATLEANTARRVDQALAAAAAEGIELTVIDLGDSEVPDTQLAGFARAAGGRLHRAAHSREVGWALTEALTGQPQSVAADASLSIEFDPRTVAAYRLLGHEANAGDGWAAPAAAEMRAGQTSTALYEMRLLPGPSDVVGVARLRWRDPATGALREEHRTIRRADFADSIARAPVSLQTAALVAETGELLRQSYFAQFGSLRDVFELARTLGPEFHQRPAIREFLSVAELALRAASPPPNGRPRTNRP